MATLIGRRVQRLSKDYLAHTQGEIIDEDSVRIRVRWDRNGDSGGNRTWLSKHGESKQWALLPEQLPPQWLWYCADNNGPWFGVVSARNREQAEQRVRAAMRDDIDAATELHLQPVTHDSDVTIATGYL